MKQAVFGIIGVGGIAQSQHLPNLTRAPHIRLKTVCDLRADILRNMQGKYGILNAETDYRKVLSDPELDALVIATREDMQAPLAIEAMEAGKHVYVEKPLAETPKEVEAVMATERKCGKKAYVGFNRRRAPAYLRAKEVVYSDGGPRNIYYRISDEYWKWGKNYKPGTRVVHETCHVFDILRWFTNSNPISIYCVESRPDDEQIVIKFASGCVAAIMNSGHVTMDLPKERIEIVSNRGAVIVEEFVECRTYGYANCNHIDRFAGHAHPDRDSTHKYLLQQGGADTLHALRRMGWETRERQARAQADGGNLDTADLQRFVQDRCPHWNYMVDKGWLSAIDHMAECILDGRPAELASAEDGWWASKMAGSAIKSRASGMAEGL